MTEADHKYDCLLLDHQLCFPLYACSKEIIRRYKPMLDVKELGKCLFLDSGTLTPVLKKLEAKGYIHRGRSRADERNLAVTITEEGMQLRERALSVPARMACCVELTQEEAQTMHSLLHKILNNLSRI